MHARLEVPEQLTRLALHQAGIVTTEQAQGLGVSRDVVARLVAQGTWQRLAVGILATKPGPPDWEALAWGGVLLGGDSARLGPVASAHQWKLAPAPDPIDILTQRQVTAAAPWRFIREASGARPTDTTGSPPRLTAADTVIDLAATLRREGDIVDVVTDALRLHLTSASRLQRSLDGRRRHPHRALLTALFRDSVGIESGLELSFLREVERPHGLPIGIRQQPDVDLPHRIDVDYHPHGVLVELDGRLVHDGKSAFRDMRRDNLHALRGATTLRFGWWNIKSDPCGAAYQVYWLLTCGGYRELFERCRRCAGIPEDKLFDLAA